MKKQIGIWIDSKTAYLIKLVNGKDSLSQIDSELENRIYHDKEGDKGTFFGHTHVQNESGFEERKANQTKVYLNEVLQAIKEFDEIYIFGPAYMKDNLKKVISQHGDLSKKLKAVNPAERMTTNQMVAEVKQFFSS